MKRIFILLITLITLISISATTDAQNLIAVQHSGTPKFYTKLTDAVNNAMAGDTVYIPGGTFEAITINKKLALIGAGHNPDSSKVTSRTMIGGINLASGSDNGIITGCYIFNAGIIVTSNINGFNISRCYVGNINLNASTVSTDNFTVSENIVDNLSLTKGKNFLLSNNIIMGQATVPDSSNVKNNLFLNNSNYQLITNISIIENNIFSQLSGSVTSYGPVFANSYDYFYNNLNGGINDGFTGNNNFLNSTPLNTLFVNFDSSILNSDAIYKVNFTLPANSSYKNAGTDGTDIGIYGGAYPWKAGSIPSNPHFQSINIAPQTDASGNLKVQITVAAQSN